MIEESGKVVEVDEHGVWVETMRQSACASCAARNGCGQKLLVQAGQEKRFIFLVNNPTSLKVQADDQVLLGIEEGAFIKATVFMYLLPLIALFLGAVIGDFIWGDELLVIASAFFSLVAGFMFVRFSSSTFFRSCQYQPTLIKVI
ncbi:SoxR reducing system RseC family protein [Neptuniibacter sp. QD72_48]|uniref:SoxR reducing system RseC family protein n=1 Tax=unclassified Neptuniibacter TaxID=2630693 RepID=UPI0039F55E03